MAAATSSSVVLATCTGGDFVIGAGDTLATVAPLACIHVQSKRGHIINLIDATSNNNVQLAVIRDSGIG